MQALLFQAVYLWIEMPSILVQTVSVKLNLRVRAIYYWHPEGETKFGSLHL
jgi:hypothetical protein